MKKYINFFGSPGSGKSTKAAELKAKLSKLGKTAEIVQETAKEYACRGNKIMGYDQLYIFSRQLETELMFEKSDTEFIICESPLVLVDFYSLYNNCPAYPEIDSITKNIIITRDELNVFIKRDIKYNSDNRFEDEFMADAISDDLSFFMEQRVKRFSYTRTTEPMDKIMRLLSL